MTADQILDTAVREAIAALRLGRRIGRTIPQPLLAKALRLATEDAAPLLYDEPHLGRTREGRWVG